MSEEEYKELNYYLNEACLYLKTQDVFFLNNISNICYINDQLNSFFKDYNFQSEFKENHLTYQDVYNLAREIIESINSDYLEDFDKLIENGQLDFGYEGEYEDSVFVHEQKDSNIYNYINIKREFNYSDVGSLVHEFIHYTNGKNNNTIKRRILTEFLSIYYENYAIDYLIDKGIPKEEIDYTIRLKSTCARTYNFYNYESPFICFIEFGEVSDKSYEMLKEYYYPIEKNNFNKECYLLLRYFQNKEKEYMKELLPKEKVDQIELRKSYGIDYSLHCRYVFGTMLAFYARKNCKKEDILYLNEHLNTEDEDIVDCLEKVGIYVNEDFLNIAFDSIIDYIKDYDIKKR